MLTKVTQLILTIFLTVCCINSLESMQKPESTEGRKNPTVYKKWDTQKKTIVLKKSYKGNLSTNKVEMKSFSTAKHPALEFVKKNMRDQFLQSFAVEVKNGLVGLDPQTQWGQLKIKLSEKTVELLQEMQKAQKNNDTKLYKILDAMADAIDELEEDSGITYPDALPEIRNLFKIFIRPPLKN
ncbi:hypothetical protein BH09DEP1_BH09DEP1_2210 [soil metagenome]